MSLPTLPVMPPHCNVEGALCQILLSIAMEEIGLSHIINAEGEKLQYILGTLPGTRHPNPSVSQVLAVNESVKDMLQQVAFNQMLLNAKMSSALKAFYHNGGDCGGGSDEPPKDPDGDDPDNDNPDNTDVGDTPDGGTVVIDGRTWIKIKTQLVNGKKYALLMLKELLGPWAYGPHNSYDLQYKSSDIKSHVDGWYTYLSSPTLKAMAVEAEVGTGTNSSWVMDGTGIYAHLPKKADVDNLPASALIAGEDYWLATPANIEGAGITAQEIVKGNGGYSIRTNDNLSTFARPIIWVKLP